MLYGIESKVVYDPRNECEANTSWYSSVSEIVEEPDHQNTPERLRCVEGIHRKLLEGIPLSFEEQGALCILLHGLKNIDTPKKQEIFFKLCVDTES